MRSSPVLVQKKQRFRWWYIPLLLILLVIIVHTLLYFVFPPRQNPIFSELKTPLNIAHQGGEHLAPSNTMEAFDLAASLGVDVIETDMHLTRDGHIVLLHDNTVDRTTDGTGRIDSFTLEEIKQLDAGYDFKDLQGEYSYRGQGVQIATLRELFAAHGADHAFILEIKEAYPKDGPSQIEAELWSLIQEFHLEKKVIIASFHQELIDTFARLSEGKVALGAGVSEVTAFVLTHKFWMPGFYRPNTNAMQIPTESSGFDLKDRNLIDGAHRLGIQVHYWTINDKPTMRELLELGADGIITDRPDLLQEVLQEMNFS